MTKPKVSSGTKGWITGIPEYMFNLEFSMILKEKLIKKGFKVVMTRETNNVNISNAERAKMANEINADLFLRIHADSSSDFRRKGFSIIITHHDDPMLLNVDYRSGEAAQTVLDEVKAKELYENIIIWYRYDLTGLNLSRVPSILIEAGFMTNPEDDFNLANNDFRNDLADAVVSGIEKYFFKTDLVFFKK